jgi:hypothetical protein
MIKVQVKIKKHKKNMMGLILQRFIKICCLNGGQKKDNKAIVPTLFCFLVCHRYFFTFSKCTEMSILSDCMGIGILPHRDA